MNPNDIEVPVFIGDEIVYMRPPEYYRYMATVANLTAFLSATEDTE